MMPSRDRPGREVSIGERRARDPGPPSAAVDEQTSVVARHPDQSAAQIDLRPHANVPLRQRFQGSRRGLGITDSAAWPQGPLRLRGIDFDVGPALQLAPAGQALGPASFAERSGPIVLPEHSFTRLAMLIANQQVPAADGLRLAWLDAAGQLLHEQVLDVPTAYDGEIHTSARDSKPRGDVALIVRSAESRLRGGGSPQLLVYLLDVAVPTIDAAPVAIELRAPGATPLLLGLTVH